jgi:hypothetical protein
MTSNSASRPIASDVDVNPDAGVAVTFPTYAIAAAPTPPTTNTHINFRRIFISLFASAPLRSRHHNRPADDATQTVKGGTPGKWRFCHGMPSIAAASQGAYNPTGDPRP